MKEKKMTAVSRLFYTFGTVLIMALVTVCVMNYSKDGRVFQMPLLSAVSGTQATQSSAGAVQSSDNYKTIKYNKPVTKTTSKSTSSKGSKSAVKATPTPNPKPAVNP